MSKVKDPETISTMVQKVAEKQAWLLNPDNKFVDVIKKGLLTNHNRYGYFLCPCRDGDGLRDEDKDIVCPCIYAKADIEEFGQCYCGLYLDKNFFARGRRPGSIPERRPL